jgi:hypothetical protein
MPQKSNKSGEPPESLTFLRAIQWRDQARRRQQPARPPIGLNRSIAAINCQHLFTLSRHAAPKMGK